jgi:hypothetical protein
MIYGLYRANIYQIDCLIYVYLMFVMVKQAILYINCFKLAYKYTSKEKQPATYLVL